jgi:hypothetical protein
LAVARVTTAETVLRGHKEIKEIQDHKEIQDLGPP